MEPNTPERAPETSDEAAKAKERINNLVAVTVALLAVFMAVTKVKDDNICQGMEREKADEVNTWSYFQSKSIKQNLAETSREQLMGLARTTSGEPHEKLHAVIKDLDKEIDRYDGEMKEIRAKAEQHGKNYEALNFRDDQFDLSDATLSIALGVLAVTALTGKRWLLVVSWIVGGFGALIGLAGLLGWKFYPSWLIQMLA